MTVPVAVGYRTLSRQSWLAGRAARAAVVPAAAREREVLALISAGRSNGEIAAQLFLGEGTVKTHVGHVFAQLGLRDRASAIVWALDSGLLIPSGPRPGP